MLNGVSPRTDTGTVLLHLLLVVIVVVLLATGLRIAADQPGLAWLAVLDWVLPMEDLWYRHMLAGVALTALAAAYIAYMSSARLGQRIRLDWARIKGLTRPGRSRWSSVNVLLVWGLLICLTTEIVTGALLYLDFGGVVLDIHLVATAGIVGAIVLHVAGHWLFGGAGQLARIVRPGGMPKPPVSLADLVAEQLASMEQRQAAPVREDAGRQSREPVGPEGPGAGGGGRRSSQLNAHPLAIAAAAALSIIVAAGLTEEATRTTLVIKRVGLHGVPVVDGDLSDPAWSEAASVGMLTTAGANFGGTGQSQVEVKGLHDGRNVYLAFTWTDPTRSLKHLPLIKQADGWHLVQSGFDTANEVRYHEDKFSVLLARGVRALIGAAIHLSPRPLSSGPAPMTRRGLHYTDGAILDVWQWRAASGPGGGFVEDGHFGPPAEASREQLEGLRRYSGGFALDDGKDGAVLNFRSEPPGGYRQPLVPIRLPADPAWTTAALGRVDDAPEHSEVDGAMWCLPFERSVPYSQAANQRFPVGSVIPGVISVEGPTGDRGSVAASARWASGRWTLEVVRALDTGSPFDTPIATGTLMWVAAFDHAQTHHTRHLRPIRLEIK